ncbi:uncharacterized protein LOC127351239 [Dicentrarchus labrax]|uniref:uncharacterized protein LOC127351239 n=1 Tax=Dicentrarchus labrax TaxID=13489 RepID=UPI0021F5C839|nr:uncharacterized protein LOC127351239 [Dicentrarchus labrax]XP_051234525.1 uncharacterized protein LOC127351239 [Dicentrarchus labrax]
MDRTRPWHPFRQPGLCGLRGTLCCLGLISVVIVVTILLTIETHTPERHNTTTSANHTNRTRTCRTAGQVKTMSHPWLNPPPKVEHLYQHNLWWRYANHTARSANHSNCYVCSLMPVASTHPKVTVSPLQGPYVDCWLQLASRGVVNDWVSNGTVYNSTTCPHSVVRLPGSANQFTLPVIPAHGQVHPICVAQTGTHSVGLIPARHCLRVLIAADIVMNDNCSNANIRNSSQPCIPPDQLYAFNRYPTSPSSTQPLCNDLDNSRCAVFKLINMSCPSGYNCTGIPFNYVHGTYPVSQAWWLCGNTVYANLRAHWSGVCAPVLVSDHTIVIYTYSDDRPRQRRNAPTFARHDPIWGTDVPQQFKHWSTSEKVAMALFPWVGTAKNTLRLETVDYRLQTFLNYTLSTLKGVKDELRSLRLLSMQNRLVLDQLTASQRGVCALVGEYCCTFVPENDADGHVISEGIANITALQAAMIADHNLGEDWFQWLFSCWKGLLLKAGVILRLFLLLTSCLIPLIRRQISSMLTRQLLAYSPLTGKEDLPTNTPDLFPIPDYGDDTDDTDDTEASDTV